MRLHFHSLRCKLSYLDLKSYKNVAALPPALKKAWDETMMEVQDIWADAPSQIKAVVQNGGGHIEYFFWPFTANL